MAKNVKEMQYYLLDSCWGQVDPRDILIFPDQIILGILHIFKRGWMEGGGGWLRKLVSVRINIQDIFWFKIQFII